VAGARSWGPQISDQRLSARRSRRSSAAMVLAWPASSSAARPADAAIGPGERANTRGAAKPAVERRRLPPSSAWPGSWRRDQKRIAGHAAEIPLDHAQHVLLLQHASKRAIKRSKSRSRGGSASVQFGQSIEHGQIGPGHEPRHERRPVGRIAIEGRQGQMAALDSAPMVSSA